MKILLARLGWTTVFAETDMPNTVQGGNAWVYAKVRPYWYWLLCRRVWLFLGIVWRPMDWHTAWSVSRVAVGLSQKRRQK